LKPYHHSNIHAKKYGGVPDDYADIDDFIDSSKQAVADVRHRAILHSAFGCFIVEQVFGRTRVNSDGKTYSPRDVAEDHIQQDIFLVPSISHYLKTFDVSFFSNYKEVSVLEHSQIDSKEYGIDINFFIPIHDFMESSYYSCSDIKHNVILHNSFGLNLVEKVFGPYIIHNNVSISPVEIAKRHIRREFNEIPSLSDVLNNLNIVEWMSGTLKSNRRKIRLVD
jgi:hypothetical protein